MTVLTIGRHPIRAFTYSLLSIACSSGAPEPKLGDEPTRCSRTLQGAKPTGDAALPAPIPTSRLVLTAELSEQQLLGEIAGQIPQTLAQAKRQPIGAPGEVTYTVTRGAMESSIRDQALKVTTLANANIEICKPLGPFCLTYGRCQPVLATTVALPMLLTSDFGWQRPTTSVRAERGCSIAGFDVTPRLTSIARDNLGGIRERIEQSLPSVKPWAMRLWDAARIRVFLDKDHCLHLEPKQFVQSIPTETRTGYRLSGGLDLDLIISRECNDKGAELPLAPLATVDELTGPSTLKLAQTIDTSLIAGQLGQQVPTAFGRGEHIERIAVSTRRNEGRNELLIAVTLDGATCGTTWLTAQVGANSDHSVRLEKVRFVTASTPPEIGRLPDHLESHASLSPSLPFSASTKRLDQLLELLASAPVERVFVTTKLEAPHALRATVDQSGVLAVAEANLLAGLTMRAEP